MGKIAIITLAGCSSRFSKSVGYECHKSIYCDNSKWTILSYQLQLLAKNKFDEIILVAGYKYNEIKQYIKYKFTNLPIHLCNNMHYKDYGSCYSLVMGIKQLKDNNDEVVFIEGDLIFDTISFEKLLNIPGDVITSNKFIVDSKTSVAFYISKKGKLKYIYDTNHKYLSINEKFTKLGNSGQVWKMVDIKKIKQIVSNYTKRDFKKTNLLPIIQYYSNTDCSKINIISFEQWFNCNTLDDYISIKKYLKGSENEKS